MNDATLWSNQSYETTDSSQSVHCGTTLKDRRRDALSVNQLDRILQADALKSIIG